jgi:hypothetical protein
MLINPLLFVPITVLLTRYRVAANPPEWSGKARMAWVLVSAFMIVAPFLVAALLGRSSEQVRAAGIHLDALLALMGIGGSAVPVVFGLVLVAYGDRLVFLHIGLLISFVTMGYWSWRERALLFGSRPHVVGRPGRQ